jgi:aminoglycoside/choline kinase family phosphotransferase
MIEHLDRIDNLGFSILLNWNKSIEIIYLADNEQSNFNQYPNDIRILFCAYDNFYEPSFDDIIETACDFFYEWYNKNIEKITDYELNSSDSNLDKLIESSIGDITKQVYRDFNIDNILG